MLELDNICWQADGKRIINNISINFEKNKMYAITGPNGSGKSSLVKIIAGIHRQSSGNIYLEGNCIDSLNITERAEEHITYSFQSPVLFRGVTVSELLDIAMKNSRNPYNKVELLSFVGLDAMAYLNRSIDGTLSGGELKRIEIATVLARNAKVLILDEPEAGIDLWSFKRFIETINNVHEHFETTLIMISHQERLLAMTDYVIHMKNGGIERVYNQESFTRHMNGECDCEDKRKCINREPLYD